MQVNSHPLSEPLDGVLPVRLEGAHLSLHDGQTVVDNLLQLILVEQVDDGAPGEDGVDVLQESLLLDILVSEQEGGSLSQSPAAFEQVLQVLHEVGGVVGPGHRHLEYSMAGYEGGHFRERLLSRATNSDQQGIAA